MSLQTFGLSTFGLNSFLLDTFGGAVGPGPAPPPDASAHLGTFAPVTFAALGTFRLGTFSGSATDASVQTLVYPLRARSALTPLSPAHNITGDYLRARTVPR